MRQLLLAGDIDRASTGAGERCRSLNQKRRFADARFATQQNHGARHESAARDPVEFGDAAGIAGRIERRALQAFERKGLATLQPRTAGSDRGRAATDDGARLFRNGVSTPGRRRTYPASDYRPRHNSGR